MRWKFVDGAVRRDTDIGARPVTRRPSCPVGLEKAGFLETRVYGRRARPVTSPLPPARRPSAPWGPGGRAAQAPGAPVRRNCCAPAVRMLTGAFSGYNRFARARTPIIGQSTRKHSDLQHNNLHRQRLRSPVVALSLGGLRRRIEAPREPTDKTRTGQDGAIPPRGTGAGSLPP